VAVVQVAVPLEIDTLLQSAAVPSIKFTVPVAPADGVAVNVTLCPYVDGFCEEVRITAGVPLVTVRVPLTEAIT
jgi:hypothetical protein